MSTPLAHRTWVQKAQVIAELGKDAPDVDGPGQVVLDDCIAAATELLYSLSGRQFPGQVSAEVRPTSKPNTFTDVMYNRYLAAGGGIGWYAGWRWGVCTGGYGCSGCCAPTKIGLGRSPIISIESVEIDGVELDQSEYRVDDSKWLVRQICCDGWPTCQDLSCPLGEPCTFGVNFTFGQDPPQLGINAAAIMAAEFYKASTPGLVCSLPARITSISRQGVSLAILDPQTFLDKGLTGNYQIDLFIKSYNPAGQIRRPMVFSPDVPNTAVRQTWP